MRKRIAFKRLGRKSSHKWAMLRNMVTSLIKHERIVTTVHKAKELRKLADHVVTLAKQENRLSGIRNANNIVQERAVLTKLFEVLGPRYAKREGGYTRVLKLSKRRKGDGAEMAVMEYVDRPGELRAARPPTSVQQEIMAKYLEEKIGLPPLSEDDIRDLQGEVESMNISKIDDKDTEGNSEEESNKNDTTDSSESESKK